MRVSRSYVEVGGRRDERRVAEADRRSCRTRGSRRSTPSRPRRASRRCARSPSARRITWSLLEAVARVGQHEVAGERVDVLEADVGAVRDDLCHECSRPASPTGVDQQREVLGAVGVREHEEARRRRRRRGARRGARRGTRRPRSRGATTRSSAAGVSASTNQTSVVSFDADVTTSSDRCASGRPRRRTARRPPGTRARRRRRACRPCGATPGTGASRRRAGRRRSSRRRSPRRARSTCRGPRRRGRRGPSPSVADTPEPQRVELTAGRGRSE